MPEPRIWRDRVSESGTRYFRARVVDRNRNVLVQTDFTGTVRKKVYDLHSEDIDDPVFEGSNTISEVFFNSLQPWEQDERGYNFEGSVTSNNVAWEGGHSYRICFFLTRSVASGEGVITIVYENIVEALIGA